MKTLLSLMNEQLGEIKGSNFKSVESFIANDKLSTQFIREMLNDKDYDEIDKTSPIYAIAEARARHSVITFLMGLVFGKFHAMIPKDKFKLWLMISLYHDIAYTSKYITQGNLNYKDEFSPFLLTDEYDESALYELRNFSLTAKDVFAYTYDQILAYDSYARKYHEKKNGIEKIDHGILGGVITFSRLIRKAIKSKSLNELKDIKSICLVIAQHNIYKSSSLENDERLPRDLEKLKSTSKFKVGLETPLLLFLSLIDTIECVKKFSKSNNKKENQYLQTLTVLKSINIEITEKEIVIDYSSLKKELALKSDLYETANNYFANVNNLGQWTQFNVFCDGNLLNISL